MNNSRVILLIFALASFSVGLWYYLHEPLQPTQLATSIAIPTSVPVAPPSQPPSAPPIGPSNDVRKTTGSGKFVSTEANNPQRTPRLPSLTPAEAEARVMEALNLAKAANGKFLLGKLEIDPASRSLMIPAKVQMRDGQLEYALVHEAGKTHESLFSTSVTPHDLHIGALLLRGVGQTPNIEVSWDTNGPPAKHDLAKLIKVSGAKPDLLTRGQWKYAGSQFNGNSFAAQTEGSCISLITDGTALVSPSNDAAGTRDDLFAPNTILLPPVGAMVRVIFTFPAAQR